MRRVRGEQGQSAPRRRPPGPSAGPAVSPAASVGRAGRTSGARTVLSIALVGLVVVAGLRLGDTSAVADSTPVLVVGDSLVHNASEDIRSSLQASGFSDVSVVAYGGTRIGWAAEQVSARSHPIVVFASGTNNWEEGWDVRDQAEAAAATSALAGRRCATWIVPVRNRFYGGQVVPDADAASVVDGINATMASTDVVLAQWGAIADDRPDWHLADGVHHTAAGRRAYAGFIADSVTRACLPVGSAADRNYVTAAFTTFLKRPPTDDEADLWARRVSAGVPKSTLTHTLATSAEWVGLEIDALYRKALGRGADAAGLEFWRRQVLSGMRLSDVAVLLYASEELWTRVGRTPGGFLDALYRAILHRAPDADGLAYWEEQMSRGLSRTGVAASFWASIESRRDRVSALYRSILGRTAEPAGRDHWAAQLLIDDDIRLAEVLAVSAEFYQRAQR